MDLNEDVSRIELLPDSRAKVVRGIEFRGGVAWVPIFCANCGKSGGLVPEENMTFAFYLCDPCGATWGHLAGTLAMPDEVFWAKVKQEQIEQYGRELSPNELVQVVEADASPLATLIIAGR